MSHRTFPKEGHKKDKQTIKDLREELSQMHKENAFLRQEIKNLVKPNRERKLEPEMTDEERRKDFVTRFKREVLNKK